MKHGVASVPADPANPVLQATYLLLDGHRKRLGTVLLERRENEWYFGAFEGLPDFKDIRPLFDGHCEAVNDGMFSLVGEIERKIEDLGLMLESTESGRSWQLTETQIGAGTLNFKIKHRPPESNGQDTALPPNGSVR